MSRDRYSLAQKKVAPCHPVGMGVDLPLGEIGQSAHPALRALVRLLARQAAHEALRQGSEIAEKHNDGDAQ